MSDQKTNITVKVLDPVKYDKLRKAAGLARTTIAEMHDYVLVVGMDDWSAEELARNYLQYVQGKIGG